MNYLMVDISGRCPNYDIALCEAMHKEMQQNDYIKLLALNINPKEIACDSSKLISFIPKKFQKIRNKPMLAIKAFNTLVNYCFLIVWLFQNNVDICHLQWLPFLEKNSVEKFFLKFLHIISPKTRFFLTVHNIYPHDCSEKNKGAYKKRFTLVGSYFDKFIVHLNTSKLEFCSDFNIDEKRVEVIPHGVFVPKNLNVIPHKLGKKINLIMFGNQSYYKGTDVLVDSLAMLPKEYKSKVHTLVVGKTSPEYLAELREKKKDSDIEFIPVHVPDDALYKYIMDSDVIVVPYREISQSGVLLLALSFKRMIIASDLPSFKETLTGFSDDMFFENGNAKSLAQLMKKYVDGKLDCNLPLQAINTLIRKYSWENVANMYRFLAYDNKDVSTESLSA